MRAIVGDRLGVKLQVLGLVPPNCNKVELHIAPTGALMLRYDVFVVVEDLPKIAAAMIEVAKEAESSAPPAVAPS
jgi:hypothetical protein